MMVYLTGLLLGFGLIMPIGAQNVYVVGQGLAVGMPRAVWAAIAAAACDSLLIVIGAVGVSGLLSAVPAIRMVLLAAGAVFLGYLGITALRQADGRLPEVAGVAEPVPVRRIVAGTASVSLLNPHAILDTVGVIGAAVVAQPAGERLVFAAGTLTASWLWFLLLAVGAAQLRRFLTPRVARWFDLFSGTVMLLFAVLFVVELIREVTG